MPIALADRRFDDPDRAYRALIEAHRGLDEAESAALNSRLVLVLALALGEADLVAEAIALAVTSGRPAED